MQSTETHSFSNTKFIAISKHIHTYIYSLSHLFTHSFTASLENFLLSFSKKYSLETINGFKEKSSLLFIARIFH